MENENKKEGTEESIFSPLYVPDKEKTKHTKAVIVTAALLLVLLVAGLVLAVAKLVEAAMGEATAAWEENSSFFGEVIEEIKDEFAKERETQPDIFQEMLPDTEDFEEFDSEETEDEFLYQDGHYLPTPEDPYYQELADSIREDLSYTVWFDSYSYQNAAQNITIMVRFPVTESDTLNTEEINACLKNGAMYYAEQFNAMEAQELTLSCMSYVTYMDENTLSVVIDERYVVNNEIQQFDLYCMNFDMKTGALLYNTDIVEVNETLVQEFRKQSRIQNENDVKKYSDEEILNYMQEESALILYYTPVGLEVGFNHPQGWISATIKDYEKYLRSL